MSIPDWLLNGHGVMETRKDGTNGMIVIRNMQRRYRELFPETPEPVMAHVLNQPEPSHPRNHRAIQASAG